MIERGKLRHTKAKLGAMLVALVMATAVAPGTVVAQPGTPLPTTVPEPTGIGILAAESTVEIDFPQGIAISANLAWDIPADDAGVELLYTIGGDDTASLAFVPTTKLSGTGELEVATTLNLQAQFVPSGIVVEYVWRLVSDQGIIAESAPERTMWFDDRWDWLEIESDQVRVHYYGLEPAFAGEILDSAQETITELEQRYGLDRSERLEIWIYPSSEDFRGARQPNSRETIAGLAYPEYFLIVAVIPDGNTREIGRTIPHEVSHQVLFQATDNPFAYPPLWFNEGMATHFQVGGTDGFLGMVVRAYESGELFDISSLDVSFPYQPAQATLAYAASWSIVEYIETTYGNHGIAALIDAFATGIPYDDAIMRALGVDSDQLNEAWKAWVDSQAA